MPFRMCDAAAFGFPWKYSKQVNKILVMATSGSEFGSAVAFSMVARIDRLYNRMDVLPRLLPLVAGLFANAICS